MISVYVLCFSGRIIFLSLEELSQEPSIRGEVREWEEPHWAGLVVRVICLHIHRPFDSMNKIMRHMREVHLMKLSTLL